MPEEKSEEINPFLLERPIEIKVFNEEYYARKKNSIKEKEFRMLRSFNYDSDESVKLFKCKELLNIIYKLKPAEYKVLMYILMHVGYSKDIIQLDSKVVSKTIGLNHRSTKVAIKGLSDKQFIRREGKWKRYYVNPHFIFTNKRPQKIEERYGEEFTTIVDDEF